MITATIGQLRGELADYVDRVGQTRERVIVTRHGREEVAIISIADLRLLERIERQIDTLIARAAMEEIREQGTVNWEDAKKRLAVSRKRVISNKDEQVQR